MDDVSGVEGLRNVGEPGSGEVENRVFAAGYFCVGWEQGGVFAEEGRKSEGPPFVKCAEFRGFTGSGGDIGFVEKGDEEVEGRCPLMYPIRATEKV